jgi:hypothetical protein
LEECGEEKYNYHSNACQDHSVVTGAIGFHLLGTSNTAVTPRL